MMPSTGRTGVMMKISQDQVILRVATCNLGSRVNHSKPVSKKSLNRRESVLEAKVQRPRDMTQTSRTVVVDQGEKDLITPGFVLLSQPI
jgi:hypothetical protein